MTYKLIDLFCGGGGMTLGFVDRRFCGGFECVLAVDNDEASIDTHKVNFAGKTVHANIEDWLMNTVENLQTLCNVHHDALHREMKKRG